MLVGLTAPKNKLLEGPKMLKEVHQHNEGVLLQLFAFQLRVDQQCPNVKAPDLQQMLEVLLGLFEKPQGLPPVWPQDHKIPLSEGSTLANVHPCRYPHYKKNEIEEIVMGLLNNRVIRASTSPYSYHTPSQFCL
jgi:hypothetical protein